MIRAIFLVIALFLTLVVWLGVEHFVFIYSRRAGLALNWASFFLMIASWMSFFSTLDL